MSVKHVSDDNFDDEVLRSNIPVLVDFWAPWCAPCRAMGPIVDELAVELEGRAKVVKVNVDEASHSGARFGVTGIPNFIVFNDGHPQVNFSGVQSKQVLRSAVEPFLADSEAAA